MGSYLLFQLENPNKATDANKFIKQTDEYTQLSNHNRAFLFWTDTDRQNVIEEHGEHALEYHRDVGEGKFKVSGVPLDIASEIKTLWTTLFRKIHNNFDIEVYRHSCALATDDNDDYYYFTPEQVTTITANGDALSG